jgi:small subunit ribosomal protein S16
VPVKIRMKMMGRKHRPFFRVCVMDGRRPRDGRILEELGTYDPLVPETDARALLNGERIAYWLGVGAQPTEKVRVLIKKYGMGGTHAGQQQSAREKLAMPRAIPDPGEPKFKLEPPAPPEAPAAEGAPEAERAQAPEAAEAAEGQG